MSLMKKKKKMSEYLCEFYRGSKRREKQTNTNH